MKKKITIFALFLMTLGACAEYDYFNRVLERGSTNTPEDVSENPTEVPDGASDGNLDYFTVTNNWQQPDNQPLVKPEIIFYVDVSGSMGNEVEALKSSLTEWIAQLSSQGVNDFCFGVAQARVNQTTGRVRAASGNDKCVCTFGDNAVSSATAVSKVKENLDAVLGASGGGGVEAAFVSMNNSLNDADVLQANQADGCFKSTTSFLPIFISDENDICAARNNGSNVFDNAVFIGEGNNFNGTRGDALFNGGNAADEANLRRQYCTNGVLNADGKYVNTLTHETLIDDLQEYNGDLPTFGAAIGYDPLDLPTTSNEDPYWGGNLFAKGFGNDMVSLKDAVDGNSGAFQDQMNQMADALVREISFFDSFSLSDRVCDVDGDDDYSDEEDQVTIKVNGSTVSGSNWSIRNSGRKIVFKQDFSWSAKDKIQISYLRCQ